MKEDNTVFQKIIQEQQLQMEEMLSNKKKMEQEHLEEKRNLSDELQRKKEQMYQNEMKRKKKNLLLQQQRTRSQTRSRSPPALNPTKGTKGSTYSHRSDMETNANTVQRQRQPKQPKTKQPRTRAEPSTTQTTFTNESMNGSMHESMNESMSDEWMSELCVSVVEWVAWTRRCVSSEIVSRLGISTDTLSNEIGLGPQNTTSNKYGNDNDNGNENDNGNGKGTCLVFGHVKPAPPLPHIFSSSSSTDIYSQKGKKNER